MSFGHIVQHETLCMTAYAGELQVSAWHDMLELLNQHDMDQAVVQFLRAITARDCGQTSLSMIGA